ncbi:recombinase family protein [Brevibacillus choshinensis]|uniref:Recombinase family protein n=1 Tax=Brevibacillus choshinensis TaxID=54911 RepID=A0ABX7FIU3_BRECH|nr:recombinase family protein [Brevibacillus choshinensis]QRG66154.1 recombinase family protein [Brevibacillus choshinensis]
MRTAVYIRVSTEEQAREGFSIAAQREKLLSYVHSQDWTLKSLYVDEGASAKDTNRPQLARLLTDIQHGEIDVVLVYRLDRLTRSVLDLYQLLQKFERYGVRFKSCTEVYDTTTAMGRLFITLVAALAQWERENLAERVKLGMEQMVKERKRPGGPPPYGYELIDGKLTVHPIEASTVKTMFAEYARGDSPRAIAEHANRQGSRGKNGAKWSASAVLRLLKNPVYYGALRWNHADAGQRQNPPEEWLLEESAHPAIVDEHTFFAVQNKIEQRSSHHPRTLSSSLLFSGLLHCSRCGSLMRGKTIRSQRIGGAPFAQAYYTCPGKRSKLCDAPAIREDRLERAMLQQLMQYSQQALEVAASLWSRQAQSRQGVELQTENALSLKRKRWEEAYAEGLISLDVFRAKLAELKAVKDMLQLPATDPGSPDSLHLLGDWGSIWSHATREEKRQLTMCLLARVDAEESVNPRRVQVSQWQFR